MLTDDQATENMAYVRRLLSRKQPGFAAALVEQELVTMREVACPRAADGTASEPPD
jgi:hypothetical protein